MRATFSKAEIESELASRFSVPFKLPEKTPREVMSTGISTIDNFAGGLPRGAITEVFGPASSGRTSLILSILTSATANEEVCALVDTSDVFAPSLAVEAGVETDRLLWVRCSSSIEHAFKAADLLLQGGGFGLVLLDLGDVAGKDARRIISSWWYRFRRVVENTPTVFMVIAQEGCVRSCASLILEMKNAVSSWSTPASSSNYFPQRKDSYTNGFNRNRSVASNLNLNNPSHSQLLVKLQFPVECPKPITSGANEATFYAEAPNS